MKYQTEINDYIQSMGNSKKIPVVYTQSEDIIIEKDNKITDKNARYNSGEDVLFQCPKCKDVIGKGKVTNEIEDKVKIFCFNCKEYVNYSNSLNWQKDALWYKPENKEQRIEFEKLIDSLLKDRKIKIISE